MPSPASVNDHPAIVDIFRKLNGPCIQNISFRETMFKLCKKYLIFWKKNKKNEGVSSKKDKILFKKFDAVWNTHKKLV